MAWLAGGCKEESEEQADLQGEDAKEKTLDVEPELETCTVEGCDDGDPCTEESCVDGECVTAPKTCGDGLFCNGVEACDPQTGDCVDGEAPALDDGIACTSDQCDEATGAVLHLPVDEQCDDGNACTADTCDEKAGCANTPLPEGGSCEDGDPCTADDVCSEGVCHGVAVDCDDGKFCNGAESCEPTTGQCMPGEPPDVDDGIACTTDACNEEEDAIVHGADHAFCEDLNPCTDDSCDPDTGCENAPNVVECDDGMACSTGDVCGNGMCVGLPLICDDGLFCNGIEECKEAGGGCVPGTPPALDDGVVCTIDTCDDETDLVVHTPEAATCDDGDGCTDEVCDPVEGCQNPFNEAPCDDLIACTGNDKCSLGQCVGEAMVCDDLQFCNGLESCDEQIGACVAGVAPALDDGVACTIDTCDEESDVAVHTPDHTVCSDSLVCTDDVCDPIEGCQNPDNSVACDDGIPCTVDDLCSEGQCWGTPVICDDATYCNGLETCDETTGECLAGKPPAVDDQVVCTVDSCSEEEDKVLHLPDHAYCNDDNLCTDDACDLALGCQNANNTLDCDDSVPCTEDDVCGNGICAGAPVICDNFKFCDGLETCDPGSGDCLSGIPPVVDDKIGCTIDSCNEEIDKVLHEPDHKLCADQNLCTDESCDPAAGCQTVNNTKPCDDQVACTDGDACAEAQCVPGKWICEDCGNQKDDNEDGHTDCCDPLCADGESCQAEALCADQYDNDCDGLVDCFDKDDCFGGEECGPYPGPGDLIITEIMQDPADPVLDSEGEWFEIYNPTETAFDLLFLEITDLGDNSFTVPESLFIEPGQHLVFGESLDPAKNGNVPVDFQYPSLVLKLGNADDELILTMLGKTIDLVGYDGGVEFPDPTGASMQLDKWSYDADSNDYGENWCESYVKWGETTQKGSPGMENPPCVPAELDCGDGQDNDGDNLTDCDDDDCVESPFCIDSDGDNVPDAYDVCPGYNDEEDLDDNGQPDGCQIDWAGDVWPLHGSNANAGEVLLAFIQVYKEGTTELDEPDPRIKAYAYYQPQGAAQSTEVAMLYNGPKGNNDEYKASIPTDGLLPGKTLSVSFKVTLTPVAGTDWDYEGAIKDQAQHEAPMVYAIVGTPVAPSAGDILITEIMKDPGKVLDSTGEWFEILNLSSKVIDMNGVTIEDAPGSGQDKHVINNAGQLLLAPHGYHVYGNNAETQTNGGVTLNYKYSGITLSNKDDELFLKAGLALLEGVAFDAGATFPTGEGASLQLSADKLDPVLNDLGASWCKSTAVYGLGDKGTPGAANKVCP
jgi:hypothetical protein